MERVPMLLRRPIFVSITLGLAAACGVLARELYRAAGKESEFLSKLGEHALQISVIVLVGAAVKEFLDWRTTARVARTREAELRAEFFRRLRSLHLAVLQSRDLMRAHKSPKTWSTQSRSLIEKMPELKEISEDLQATAALFGGEQQQIVEGLDGMLRYLARCRDEYIDSHEFVDADWHAKKPFEETIREREMTWLKDFLSGDGTFNTGYTSALLGAKLPMRRAVFGTRT